MRPLFPIVALTAVALAACGTSSGASPTPTSDSSSSTGVSGTLTVFAASSLKESFTAIGSAFEAANPGVRVTFNFGPSSGLATQITEGAPADVFASASQKTMDTVSAASLASSSQVFAVNSLEVATPSQQTVPVTTLADLAKPGVKVAVCQQDVPCGAAALTLFEQNRLTVTPVSQEVDVKAVLSKVRLGEVDAGVVYVTDVKAAKGGVTGVPIPADQNVTTKYPIAAISSSKNAAAADAFTRYVLSPPAQQVLKDAGFTSP
jgi:molybdate transport system substrate-binding protein